MNTLLKLNDFLSLTFLSPIIVFWKLFKVNNEVQFYINSQILQFQGLFYRPRHLFTNVETCDKENILLTSVMHLLFSV